MTNQEAKQEAIKKAWDKNYDLVKDRLYGGWYDAEINEKPLLFGYKMEDVEHSTSSYMFRPISLNGIHDNNGWIRIEPDGSNLPIKSNGLYHTGFFEVNGKFKIFDNVVSHDTVIEYFRSGVITHYFEQKQIPNAIY